jgi:molecular chaperone Hsp33
MGLTNEQILDIAMKDIPYDIFDKLEVEYKCDCSRDRMKKKILSLGKNEVKNLLDEQEAEGKARDLTAICRFCNSEYTFTEKELLG